MIIHIHKENLIKSFSFRDDKFDLRTENMIEDMLSSSDISDFRLNYPDGYAHFIEHFHDTSDTNESYQEFLAELFIQQIFGYENEDDGD